jgi:hypothetical protein
MTKPGCIHPLADKLAAPGDRYGREPLLVRLDANIFFPRCLRSAFCIAAKRLAFSAARDSMNALNNIEEFQSELTMTFHREHAQAILRGIPMGGQVGQAEKLSRIFGHILPDNFEMQDLANRAGFNLTMEPDGSQFTAEYFP